MSSARFQTPNCGSRISAPDFDGNVVADGHLVGRQRNEGIPVVQYLVRHAFVESAGMAQVGLVSESGANLVLQPPLQAQASQREEGVRHALEPSKQHRRHGLAYLAQKRVEVLSQVGGAEVLCPEPPHASSESGHRQHFLGRHSPSQYNGQRQPQRTPIRFDAAAFDAHAFGEWCRFAKPSQASKCLMHHSGGANSVGTATGRDVFCMQVPDVPGI